MVGGWTKQELRDGKPTSTKCPECGSKLTQLPSAGIGASPPLVLQCKKCGYRSVNGKKFIGAREKAEARLKEIIQMAGKLNWVRPIDRDTQVQDPEAKHGTFYESVPSYPLMQLSEVEKCMLAMVDDSELRWLREWTKDL